MTPIMRRKVITKMVEDVKDLSPEKILERAQQYTDDWLRELSDKALGEQFREEYGQHPLDHWAFEED